MLRTVPAPEGSPEGLSSRLPPSDDATHGLRAPEGHGLNDSTSTVYAGPSHQPSILETPPRPQHATSGLKLAFNSPSPPPGLPDLPTTDDEDTALQPTRLFNTEGKSMMKTPKAPGAWVDTPVQARRPRSLSDSSATGDRFARIASGSNGPNWSTMQTPKPPGGWNGTPARDMFQRRRVDQSVETDTEPETDAAPAPTPESAQNGLATPTSSLSKASRYPQTPAAPGAWIQTPANRKSVMKVRFDPDANETREFGDSDFSAAENLNSSTNSQATQTMSPPASPERSSVKKGPAIRVLDAYGNPESEVKEEEEEVPLRVLDVLGEVVKEESFDEESSRIISKGSREEMLSKVRNGLDELVTAMHEEERKTALTPSELGLVKELESVTLLAREKRQRLTSEIKKNEDDFKTVHGTDLLSATPSTTKPSFWHIGSRFFFLAFIQLVIAIFMYRLLNTRAEELFLTTYYDPLQPDLHQDIFKSRLHLSTSPDRFVSWLSLLDLLREQGIWACAAQTRDNISITVTSLQSYIWERFGDDGSYFNFAWPPT